MALNLVKLPTNKPTTPVTAVAGAATAALAPNGGINYNTANAADKTAIQKNQSQIANDPTFKNSEIDRTKAVMALMQSKDPNADVSAQKKYLYQNLGYQDPANGPSTTTSGAVSNAGAPGEDYIRNNYNLGVQSAQQQAYDARNQSDVNNMQEAQRQKEVMASLGLLPSGDYLSLQAGQASNRLNGINSVNNQLASNINQLGMSQNDQLLQNLYRNQDVDFRNNQFDWQKQTDLANLLGSINGQDTLAKQGQDWGKQVDTANLTGQFNGQKTADQAQRDWENSFNYGNAIGQFSNGQQTLASKGQQFDQNMANKQFDRGVLESDRTYNYQVGRDKVGDSQWQQEFQQRMKQDGIQNALSWANYTLSKSNSAADNARADAGLTLDREKFDYSKSQDALANNGAAKLSAKDSTDNYNTLMTDLTGGNVDKVTAQRLLQANRDSLTDADYKSLSSYINANY